MRHRGFLKRTAAAAVFALLAGLPGLLGTESPASASFTLDNGLRVSLVENHNLPLLHAVIGVKAGSRNETSETSGLTHVLEHVILFRGSRTRAADDITLDIRKNGGHFNAHTGQDISLFELTLPAGRGEFALRILADILFNLAIDPQGLDAEREVILRELSHAEDDPFRNALAHVYRSLFPGHGYSLPVAGTRDSILRLKPGQIETFYRAYYTPSNSALAVVGDFRLDDMEKTVREIFGPLPRASLPPQPLDPPAPLRKDLDITLEMNVAKAVCVLGFAGPDYNHPDQFAVDLLTEILGRGINPLLGAALRGERKLAESVSMDFHAHELGGALIITLALDSQRVKAAVRETLSFLRSSRRLNFSPDDVFGEEQDAVFDYLESAKNQVRFLSEKSRERGLNLAASLARHLLLSRGAASGGYLEQVERMTTSDLRQAAARYFSSGKAVIVSVVPSNPERRR